MKFLCLGSGSSGNCYFLGTDEYGMLIDAGVGIKTVKKVLKANGIDFQKIWAIFVTHDHSDHIKTVACLGEKYGIPVYATEAVHEGIAKNRYIGKPLYTSRRYIKKEVPFEWRDFTVTPFDVPHDGTDNVGFHIVHKKQRFTLVTDLGHITETVAKYICQSNHLIVEANYDEEMLSQGKYPDFLKQRISGPTGHLSNRETAEFLAQHFEPHLKNIWLCHLSKDNNHAELACQTVETALSAYGIRVGKDVNLMALKRTSPSEVFNIECSE
ncbi:MAG: MBL fold metallo-hydrolase [Bacteroidales bacterium]|jgi:phosphoribosyl 1,2-cyclic phosphodiesterase|nr:MBL fold metallo-hydrolase [Bacteroidales bacterium]